MDVFEPIIFLQTIIYDAEFAEYTELLYFWNAALAATPQPENSALADNW